MTDTEGWNESLSDKERAALKQMDEAVSTLLLASDDDRMDTDWGAIMYALGRDSDGRLLTQEELESGDFPHGS